MHNPSASPNTCRKSCADNNGRVFTASVSSASFVLAVAETAEPGKEGGLDRNMSLGVGGHPRAVRCLLQSLSKKKISYVPKKSKQKNVTSRKFFFVKHHTHIFIKKTLF
jgi:hypothetical protein